MRAVPVSKIIAVIGGCLLLWFFIAVSSASKPAIVAPPTNTAQENAAMLGRQQADMKQTCRDAITLNNLGIDVSAQAQAIRERIKKATHSDEGQLIAQCQTKRENLGLAKINFGWPRIVVTPPADLR